MNISRKIQGLCNLRVLLLSLLREALQHEHLEEDSRPLQLVGLVAQPAPRGFTTGTSRGRQVDNLFIEDDRMS